jgi:predicted amidohydrolase YtcJ
MYHAAPIRRTLILPAAHAVLLVVLRLALTGIDAASAQPVGSSPDTILINGKLAVYEGPPAQALAVRGDTIAAIGSTQAIRALAGTSTRIIDLGGRTVIPGLIDSHIHAIRAGLGYAVEVHWFDVRTLQEALNRLRIAARHAPKGAWLVVAGGWTERQFREDRRPTQKEIVAAAPDHRVVHPVVLQQSAARPARGRGVGHCRQP